MVSWMPGCSWTIACQACSSWGVRVRTNASVSASRAVSLTAVSGWGASSSAAGASGCPAGSSAVSGSSLAASSAAGACPSFAAGCSVSFSGVSGTSGFYAGTGSPEPSSCVSSAATGTTGGIHWDSIRLVPRQSEAIAASSARAGRCRGDFFIRSSPFFCFLPSVPGNRAEKTDSRTENAPGGESVMESDFSASVSPHFRPFMMEVSHDVEIVGIYMIGKF